MSSAAVSNRPELIGHRVRHKPLTPATLAHAIRIAAKMAREAPQSNPLFVEALEVAATHFDIHSPCARRPREQTARPPATARSEGNRDTRKYTRRVERNARHCAMVTCCGKTFPAGFRDKHEAGLLHRAQQQVRDLLSQPGMTNRKIAKQLGCSHERVAQIIKHLGAAPALKRSAEFVVNRSRQHTLDHPLVSAFIQAAESNGVACELMTATGRREFLQRAISANGYLVQLRKTKYNRNGYVTLHRRNSDKQVDFMAYLLQNTGQWIIVPWAKRPIHQTTFAVEPNLDAIGMTADNRHDWPQFLNAWHLLTEPKA